MEESNIKEQHHNSCQQTQSLFKSLIGKSQSMQKVQQEILQVANCTANVLILGESGTGKEVVARSVHCVSDRSNKNFVPVNCGAIPPDLLESELFGHEKGAFTGAITSRAGRFSMAEGGTLFLDEIGEMTMAMQVKLLRVLEERVFERVGGSETIIADVRIIAATNRNLEEMVRQGKFREDLFFRLDVFPIKIPALRDRIQDIPMLTSELINRLERSNQNSVRFSKDAIITMSKYEWPGNVRELSNLVERMSITHPHGTVKVSDLPTRIRACEDSEIKGLNSDDLEDISLPAQQRSDLSIKTPGVIFPTEGFDLKTYISNMEVQLIKNALDSTGGVIAHAAKSLGLRRTTLAEKMRKYHIDREVTQSGANAC